MDVDDQNLVLPKFKDLYYSGEWHRPMAGRYFSTTNPATGEELAQVAEANAEDIDQVVQAAALAFPKWRALPPLVRAAKLRLAALRLRKFAGKLGLLDALDSGNPRPAMVRDIEMAAVSLDFFAGLVTEIKDETIPMGELVLNYVLREPIGVIALITPFNHPALFAAGYIAAPLAAGNTVVLKPAEQTPLSALKIAEIIGDIFPPGFLNVIPGRHEAGKALTTHPHVGKISFIGSIPTGRAIMQSAGSSIKHLTLELGGKNAFIVYPDVDPDQAAASAVHGMNLSWTAGQSCGSTSRVFVHEAIHDQVLKKMIHLLSNIQLSLPSNPSCQMGCLASSEQYDRVVGYVQTGIEQGAQLQYGGTRPKDPQLQGGNFLLPTLFSNVRPSMRIAREEVFGPVISVLKWEDEEQMLQDVNGVEYGLSAAIWTKNLSVAHLAAARIEAGYIWINTSSSHFFGAPFGGYKQSGIGRMECIHELLDCTQLKNVHVALA